MVSEWPIRAKPRARAAPAECWFRGPLSDDRRLADATLDLFLPDAHRLTDRVRASVSTMLDGVVSAVERDLRSAIAPHFADRPELAASLASASVDIALPLLSDARALRHPELVAIVLRRAGEFVLAQRLAPEGGGPGDGLPLDDADPGVRSAADAVLIAQARRIDRFGEAALLLDDLPAELAHWLVWRVAAALRHYLCAHHAIPEAQADALIVPAAGDMLSEHDEGRGLSAAASMLAFKLAGADRIDGECLTSFLGAGQVAAFNAALALATGLRPSEVWNVVSDGADGRLALLLRAARVDRASAGAILLLVGGMDAAGEIDLFDACGEDAARVTVAKLALPAEYCAATAALGVALVDPDLAA